MTEFELSVPPSRRRLLGPFVSHTGLAKWVVVLLIITALVHITLVVSTMSQIRLLNRVAAGELLGDGEAAANDTRQQTIAILQTLAYLVTGVLFMSWLRGAYMNLPALSSRTPSFTPGWTIGAWLVPLLNFVRPFQIVRETWWVSAHPAAADEAMFRAEPTASPLIRWWWGTYVAALLFGRVVVTMSRTAKEVTALQTVSMMTIVSELIYLAAAILAILVVREISMQQDARAREAAEIDDQLVAVTPRTASGDD